MMIVRNFTAFALLIVVFNASCYSFKGISIDPRVLTFSVANFEQSANNAPPTLALDFTERLKDKIRVETRLVLRNEAPDVEFVGRITDFRVIPVAPQAGEVVAANQLIITIEVEAVNNREDEIKWPERKTFRHFQEFSNDVDLLTVQDRLITDISRQLLDDIFNYFFNNW